MLRNLIADCKEFPATILLSASWAVIYLAMLLTRFGESPAPSAMDLVLGNIGNGHRFGDLTLHELFKGEVWRTVTCTFVHYNLLHIAMNLFGMYQLGCLIESWYGSAQSVAIYVLIGGGGNLISGLIRRELGSNPQIHSGGGSTVVLGLVALCAVVGWRSKTRVGEYLRRQMVGILVLTAVVGLLVRIIDNWGHAGGAIVGAAIGFAHPVLVRNAHRPLAHFSGVIGFLVLAACGAAQWREDYNEAPSRALERVNSSRRVIAVLKEVQLLRGEPRMPRSTIYSKILFRLDVLRKELDRPPTANDYRRLRALLERDRDQKATAADRDEIRTLLRSLFRRLAEERDLAIRHYVALSNSRRAR